MRSHLRTVVLRPYITGLGPVFYLKLWAADRTDWRGQTRIAYELRQDGKVLFSGADFCGSPLDADDSDATVAALLGFLTLRPGDTDAEYFENYTPEQLEFCSLHAEALGIEALRRFGNEN